MERTSFQFSFTKLSTLKKRPMSIMLECRRLWRKTTRSGRLRWSNLTTGAGPSALKPPSNRRTPKNRGRQGATRWMPPLVNLPSTRKGWPLTVLWNLKRSKMWLQRIRKEAKCLKETALKLEKLSWRETIKSWITRADSAGLTNKGRMIQSIASIFLPRPRISRMMWSDLIMLTIRLPRLRIWGKKCDQDSL